MTMNAAGARFKLSDGNLGLLQEYLRRDPESYLEEFTEQFHHFLQSMKLLELQPQMHRTGVEQLLEVVNFIASVAFCYPEKSKEFVASLIAALASSNVANEMDSELRLGFCRAIMMQTNSRKRLVDAMQVLPVFFELVNCDDKQLRKFILGAIISLIKAAKTGSKNKAKKSFRKSKKKRGIVDSRIKIALSPESTKIQTYVFNQLKDSRSMCARTAQMVLIEAYRRGYWRDAKTANVLAMDCVFHKVRRVQVGTIKFFLGSIKDEEGLEGDSDSDDEGTGKKDDVQALRDVAFSVRHGKKTRKGEKQLDKAKKAIGREKKSKKEHRSKFCNLEAMRAIYDPQKFADRLFGCLESNKNEKFVVRLLQIALCARMIGIHQLQTLGFYSYMHRYLQPKQKEVTRILLYAAQACHELVPPDLIEQLVRVIAQNFVTDRNTAEAMTVGLNTIREIFSNCPAAATEEFLRDLAEYKSYKNKNVSMAARGLITLFRSINPRLLHQKDRGRPASAKDSVVEIQQKKKLSYGATNTVDFVPGSEILPKDGPPQIAEDSVESDEDDWVDVAGSDENDEGVQNAGDQSEEDDDEEQGEWETDEDDESIVEEVANSEGVDEDLSDADENNRASNEDAESASSRCFKRKVHFKISKAQRKKEKAREKLEAEKSALDKAKIVSESRILTDIDFRMIRAHQIRKELNLTNKLDKGSRKRTNDEVMLDEEVQEKIAKKEVGGDGLARLNDIEHFHKKLKQNKQERKAQASEGRDERDKFGRPKKRGAHIGRTNREMAKRKNFQMVRQKVRGKNRQRSFRDQQISLRNYLLRQSGKKV